MKIKTWEHWLLSTVYMLFWGKIKEKIKKVNVCYIIEASLNVLLT